MYKSLNTVMDVLASTFSSRKSIALATGGALLLLTSCAGGVGGGSDNAESIGDGFEYGAEQSIVEEAIDGLEPVTLTYQPTAASPESKAAPAIFGFKDAVEERSNGQITIDVVWGQAIASFDELEDALLDGRVDIGHMIPTYDPAGFPEFTNILPISQFAPASPVIGELAATAMITDVAMQEEAVIEEFTDKGLVPLIPPLNGGELYFACNPNNSEVDLESWRGRQTRVGSTLNEMVVSSIDANPVSLEFVETFEGLQRNTVDCTLTPLTTAAETDAATVAPNLSYLPDTSVAGRASSAQVAGPNFKELPLAYQQIVFDAGSEFYAGWLQNITDSSLKTVQQSTENDGVVTPLPEDAANMIVEAQRESVETFASEGRLPENIQETATRSAEEWVAIAEELGYEDGGTLAEMDSWYTEGSIDFLPFTDRLMEELLLPIRPQ